MTQGEEFFLKQLQKGDPIFKKSGNIFQEKLTRVLEGVKHVFIVIEELETSPIM